MAHRESIQAHIDATLQIYKESLILNAWDLAICLVFAWEILTFDSCQDEDSHMNPKKYHRFHKIH